MRAAQNDCHMHAALRMVRPGQMLLRRGFAREGSERRMHAEQAQEEHEAQLRRKDAEAERLSTELQRAHAAAQEAAAQAEAARKAAQRFKVRLAEAHAPLSPRMHPVLRSPAAAMYTACGSLAQGQLARIQDLGGCMMGCGAVRCCTTTEAAALSV